MSKEDLKKKLKEARNEFASERGAIASGTKSAGLSRSLKKLIARILTILRERGEKE